MNTQFKIVVPVYNADKWIHKCLTSIRSQVHKNYDCIIYDDCSTDNTTQVIEDFMKDFGDERFQVVYNSQNKKTLSNLLDGYRRLDAISNPESVLAVVDGDDLLFSEWSLSIVDHVYRNSEAKMTYGSFVHWPTGEISNFSRIIPRDVIDGNLYRDYPFVTSHLRTYKSYLWNEIKDEDLRDVNGQYFSVACDVATMIPMLEMSGGKFVHIPNILYVYNRINPLSDDVINSTDQGRIDRLIRTRKKYEILK